MAGTSLAPVFWGMLAFLSGAYLLMTALLFVQQGRLLFLPDVPTREVRQTPLEVGLRFDSVTIVAADGVRLHGWFVPAAGTQRAVLFFHGNAGNISHRLGSLVLLHRLGLSTLIIDYRGYGRSEGSPSEEGTYLDAEAAWRYLTEERGVSPAQIVLFGRSLGAALAAYLASRHEPGGLILESGFSSIPDLAAWHYPIFPVRLLARYRYPTVERLHQVGCPTLVIHSRDDEVVPISQGRALYQALSAPKSFLELRGSHNDAIRVSEAAYEAGLREFLATVPFPNHGRDGLSPPGSPDEGSAPARIPKGFWLTP